MLLFFLILYPIKKNSHIIDIQAIFSKFINQISIIAVGIFLWSKINISDNKLSFLIIWTQIYILAETNSIKSVWKWYTRVLLFRCRVFLKQVLWIFSASSTKVCPNIQKLSGRCIPNSAFNEGRNISTIIDDGNFMNNLVICWWVLHRLLYNLIKYVYPLS